MKYLRNKSFKLIVICMAMALCIVILCATYLIQGTTEDIRIQESRYLSEQASQNAYHIKRTTDLHLDKLSSIANIISNQNNFSTENIMNILKLEAEHSVFKRMGFALPSGEALVTDDAVLNVSDRDYFARSLLGENVISDRMIDKVDGLAINTHSVPLKHNGEIVGCIFATTKASVYSAALSTSSFSGTGFSYVITSEGVPVVYSNLETDIYEYHNFFDEITTQNEEYTKMKADLQNGTSGTIEIVFNGEECLAAYCKVDINDWYTVSIVPKSSLSQYANKITARNTYTTIILLIVFILLVLFIFLQNRKSTKNLEKMVYFDTLTGAPNVEKFKLEATRFMKDFPNQKYLMVKFDIDQFKLINQILGFDVGDTVLKTISEALRQNTAGKYLRYARQHDDEFLVLHTYQTPEDLIEIRNVFINNFNRLMGDDFNFFVKMISGHYYMTDDNCTDISVAIEKANVAHQNAKLHNLEISIYIDDFALRLIKNKDIENKMHPALQSGEFKVYLQPKYNLTNEKLVGAEALVRWQTENDEIILPNNFIPIFEQNGFITKLDMYIFEQVCCLLRLWREQGIPVMPISINFSRLHLSNTNFIQRLIDIADKYETPRELIELELTETVIFENENILSQVIEQIHTAGFTLSMDDFGSGYSSLGLLKNLAVDIIKIDRSFFENDTDKERAKSVVGSVTEMAKKLKIHTVAEGVETLEQVEFLKAVGCDIVQGYYYAKPMPVAQFVELISKT